MQVATPPTANEFRGGTAGVTLRPVSGADIVSLITDEHLLHRCFLTLACVCVRGLKVVFVSACSCLALVTGVGAYVLAGVEIGVLSRKFLYFFGC